MTLITRLFLIMALGIGHSSDCIAQWLLNSVSQAEANNAANANNTKENAQQAQEAAQIEKNHQERKKKREEKKKAHQEAKKAKKEKAHKN